MKSHQQSKQMLRLLFWESTIKCNLNCAHCRRLESDETASKDLTNNQGRDLIKQLAQLGQNQSVMPVLVFSGGEPLCRGDLFELVEYAKSLGIVSALASNGTLIDEKIARQINKSGIARVSISLDGSTAQIHNRLRKVDGSFESAIEGIKFLHAKQVPFQINITLTRHNASQLKEVYELAKSLGAAALHIFMLVPVGCGQMLEQTDMLSPKEYEKKLIEICELESVGQLQVKVTCGPHYERVVREQGLFQSRKKVALGDSSSTVPGRSGHGRPARGCLAGLGVLFVSHQGDVFPCGYLPVKCGNILMQNLSDIWYNNKDLARMRDSNYLEGKCGICGYREICGGCRGRAYAAAGNYMAEEPFCAYIPPETAS